MRTSRFLGACAVALAMMSGAAVADDYPSRPIRLVLGFPPGGALDLYARVVAPALSQSLGVQVVVENQPGAGGSIAAAGVAKAPPDGYTLLASGSSLAFGDAVGGAMPFDPARDFNAITLGNGEPPLLVVGKDSAFARLEELVAAAKASPGTLNAATPGIGSALHITTEFFCRAAGIRATHIPYKGGGPEIAKDLLTGRVHFFVAPNSFAAPLVRDGRLRALAIAGPNRSRALPEVPTLAEAGVAGFEHLGGWFGIWVRSGTPPRVLDALAAAARKVNADPGVRERLGRLGLTPSERTPASIDEMVRGERERVLSLMRDGEMACK